MTPEQIDRVFGCGRLQMVTGKHVEVFREAAAAGTRRRYTKRFLHTLEADFGQWTDREWRILARLIGHGIACVPEVVQYDRGAPGGTQLVQTYDAGVTVDQWATILPVMRNGRTLHHVFEDCAHWWALAHHCLRALQAIHELSVVHLDIKGDNVCIPVGPPGFDPHGADLHIFPRFADLALIDFAFSLVSRESLTTALPIGWQTDYDYQSPRLLHALEAGRRGDLQPTRQLDWRCDMYSLGAMLKRYLPDDEVAHDPAQAEGWSAAHVQAAKELILALREAHDGEATLRQPHARLLELTAVRLADTDMAASLAAGWTLARDANVTPVAATPATPVTRLAPPLRVLVTPRVTIEPPEVPVVVRRRPSPSPPPPPLRVRRGSGRLGAPAAVLALVAVGAIAFSAPDLAGRWTPIGELATTMSNAARAAFERAQPRAVPPAAAGMSAPDLPSAPAAAPVAANTDAPASSADAAEPAQVDAPGSITDAGAAVQDVASAVPPAVAPAPGRERRAEPALPSLATEARSPKATPATAPVATAPASPRQPPAAVAARPRSNQGAKVAVAPPRPSKVASARPRPNTATTSKVAPTVAVATPQKRIRFFDDDPSRSAASSGTVAPVAASAASKGEKAPPLPEPVAIESVAAAPAEIGAPPAIAPGPPVAATAPAKVPPAPRPPPPKAGPPAASEQRSIFAALADLAWRRDRGRAPIEDRTVPSASAPPGSRSPAATLAPPATPGNAGSETMRAIAPAAAAPSVNALPAPAPADNMRTPATTPPADDARTPATAPTGDDVRMPAAVPPAPEPRPVPRELAPRFAPPGSHATRDLYRGSETDTPDLAAQARHTLAVSVPYAAARAQGEVARVLRVAANARHPTQEADIVDAVRRGWPSYQIATSVPNILPASALQLNEEARRAYVVQRNVGQAFDLQLRAFGANPRDAEVAGNLAFLFLRVDPTQAETARRLSLHAIALRASQTRAAVVDDWSTLAIASALTGREADATHALYVAVALSRDLDRSCRAALGAVDRYGDIMVAPVQAMMSRIRQHGRDGESSYCAWPIHSRTARGY